MVLVWREDTNPDSWTPAELENYFELYELGLKIDLCVPVPRPFPSSTVEIESKVGPADFFFAGLVFVVSGELRTLIEEFKVNCEFVELDVVYNEKKYLTKQYYFCNLLDSVECLDYSESEYQSSPVGITGITKLVVDPALATGSDLFRIGPVPEGGSPNPKAVRDVIRCVSEELASRIIENGITGVEFVRPQDRHVHPAPPWKSQ